MQRLLENSSSNLDLIRFTYRGETYYRNRGNIFDSNIKKFEKSLFDFNKDQMSEALKKATASFMDSLVREIFENFDGKIVGKDFTVEDCVKILVDMPDETVPAKNGGGQKVVKTKVVKTKVKRKKSGYNIWISEHKEEINKKIVEIHNETGEKKKPVEVAGPMWTGLDQSVREEYQQKAKEMD